MRSKEEVIESLKRFPNPNSIWSAFRAGIIDEETTLKLLPKPKPPGFFEILCDVIFGRMGFDE